MHRVRSCGINFGFVGTFMSLGGLSLILYSVFRLFLIVIKQDVCLSMTW